MMDEKILKIQHTLKKELDENRYHHTLGVMSRLLQWPCVMM